MKQLTLDFSFTSKPLTAQDYKDGLPRTSNGLGIKWTMETFGAYVNLLYPHITLVRGQVWTGARSKYKLICEEHGEYEATAGNVLNESQRCQCRGCDADRKKASAGNIRTPRATNEEKDLAAKLKLQGLGVCEIARQIGRAQKTVSKWLDPEQAERSRQADAIWRSENRERKRATDRRYLQFEHGKAGNRAHVAHRRLLKQNTPEFIFLDGQWHEVDRKETYSVFSEVLLPAKERKAIQELYMEAQYQTEKTGVEHHVDHLQPLSKGGEHLMINLQIIPADENLSKHNTFRVEDQALICHRLFN